MISKTHNERCKDCKENVRDLLYAIFDGVQVNYNVNRPARLEDYTDTHIYDDIARVYFALQDYRGHKEFVKVKKLRRVDFFIPSRNLVVEFDESQHFSEAREKALGLYPAGREFGFSVDRWRLLSKTLQSRDNDPPYRDEQRAWYDTIRDFVPFLWETGKTMRLFSRDYEWCSLDPKDESDLQKFMGFLSTG